MNGNVALEFEELLEAERTGRLDEHRRRQLEALCREDPALARRRRDELRLWELLGPLGPNPAPEGLARSVLERLDAEQRASSRSRLGRAWPTLRWAGAAALVAVIVLQVAVLVRSERTERMRLGRKAESFQLAGAPEKTADRLGQMSAGPDPSQQAAEAAVPTHDDRPAPADPSARTSPPASAERRIAMAPQPSATPPHAETPDSKLDASPGTNGGRAVPPREAHDFFPAYGHGLGGSHEEDSGEPANRVEHRIADRASGQQVLWNRHVKGVGAPDVVMVVHAAGTAPASDPDATGPESRRFPRDPGPLLLREPSADVATKSLLPAAPRPTGGPTPTQPPRPTAPGIRDIEIAVAMAGGTIVNRQLAAESGGAETTRIECLMTEAQIRTFRQLLAEKGLQAAFEPSRTGLQERQGGESTDTLTVGDRIPGPRVPLAFQEGPSSAPIAPQPEPTPPTERPLVRRVLLVVR